MQTYCSFGKIEDILCNCSGTGSRTRSPKAATPTTEEWKTRQPLLAFCSCTSCAAYCLDLGWKDSANPSAIPRKEVIQPHLPVRLPCYDFTPITDPTLDACLPQGVSPAASGVADFRGVTGGVYKTRERIHRSVLTYGY